MTIDEWLTQYDALETEHQRVIEMKNASEADSNYAEADEAAADLNEMYADLAHRAAGVLRELQKNSTLPDKAWRHLDGTICTAASVRGGLHVTSPSMAFCDEHDRRVRWSS